MRTIKLTISYDGTGLCGWQVQPNGESVQGLIQRALAEMVGGHTPIVGAGRTDAGVHALGQVASFQTSAGIPLEGFLKGLNSLLPPQVAIVAAEEVGEGFDAMRSARGKIYRYLVLESKVRAPLLEGRCWRLREALDLAAMREGSRCLIGKYDFESFRASGCTANDAVRLVNRIDISEEDHSSCLRELPAGARLLSLEFQGEGFVRHMIRNIVGTLVAVGRGAISQSDVGRILEARERKEAGVCAPACGLYLVKVIY